MEDFQQVVFESLLGDGSVYTPHECKNAAFMYRQIAPHRDAVEQRYAVISQFIKSTKSYTLEKRVNRYPSYGFYTAVSQELAELRNLVYSNSVKTIPANYAANIGWRGVAWWYMDDGSLDVLRNGRKVSASFATDGFNLTDCITLQQFIYNNLGVFLQIHKSKVNKAGQQTYRMRVSRSTFDLFMTGIREYVVPSFYYKLAVREAPGKYTRMKIQSDLTGNSESMTEMSCRTAKQMCSNI